MTEIPTRRNPDRMLSWRSPDPAGPPLSADLDDGAEIKKRLLAALWRYKWLIVVLTVGGTAAGYGLVRLLPAAYRAEGTLWIEVADRARAERGPIQPDQLLESRGWIDLLRSYELLDDVVRQHRLYLITAPADSARFRRFELFDPFRAGEYVLRVSDSGRWVLTSGDMRIEEAAAGAWVGRAVGFAWQPPAGDLPPGRAVTFRVEVPREVATELADALRVRAEPKGSFLRVELQGTDPHRVAHTLNAVLNRFVEVAAQLKREKLTELAKILDEQLRYAQRHLADAELRLESFRVRTITLPSDQATPVVPGLELTRDPVFASFFELKTEREQLRQESASLRRILGQASQGALDTDALAAIGGVQQLPELGQALRELASKRAELRAMGHRYTDDHAHVRRLAEEVRRLEEVTVPRLATALALQMADRERMLDTLIGSASSELRRIPPRAIEEARLRREVVIAENLYMTLQQRYEEARLSEVSSIPDVRVLDQAAPPRAPLRDTLPRFLMLGFAVGLGLGVLGAVVLDRVDARVRYPEHVVQQLRLPILGALPHTPWGKGAIRGTGNPESTRQVLEALRSLRLALEYANGPGPIVLTVTSPGARDGKSFLASNLALSFAAGGRRTILVDGDVRRGALHRLFGVARAPGLVDHLAGRATLEQVVQTTRHALLSLVSAGSGSEDAPELLSSAALKQLVDALEARADVVLVDSAPLGAGADAYVLAIVTRQLLLVLRTGLTDRDLAQTKLELVDRLPIRLLGAVLNDVQPDSPYAYYTYYLPGYAAHAESEAGAHAGRAT